MLTAGRAHERTNERKTGSLFRALPEAGATKKKPKKTCDLSLNPTNLKHENNITMVLHRIRLLNDSARALTKAEHVCCERERGFCNYDLGQNSISLIHMPNACLECVARFKYLH